MKNRTILRVYFSELSGLVVGLLWVFALLVLASCASPLQNAQEQTVEPTKNSDITLSNISDASTLPLLSIDYAKIYCWWWSESVVRRGFDGDNPPPKDQYIEVKKWEYDGDGLK